MSAKSKQVNDTTDSVGLVVATDHSLRRGVGTDAERQSEIMSNETMFKSQMLQTKDNEAWRRGLQADGGFARLQQAR